MGQFLDTKVGKLLNRLFQTFAADFNSLALASTEVILIHQIYQIWAVLDLAWNPYVHLMTGLGGDTYKFSGYWGAAGILSIRLRALKEPR